MFIYVLLFRLKKCDVYIYKYYIMMYIYGYIFIFHIYDSCPLTLVVCKHFYVLLLSIPHMVIFYGKLLFLGSITDIFGNQLPRG